MSKLNRKFHPGVYLKDIIDEYGMSHHEFAMRLGMDDKRLSLIVNEKSRITVDDALKLSQLLNTSVDVWLNLQNAYDIYITKLNKQNEFEYEKEIYRLIDASFLKKVHIISNERTIEEKIEKLKNKLFISNLETLKNKDFLTLCRSTNHEVTTENIILRNLWIAIALSKVNQDEENLFDEKKLKSYLPKFREMSLQSPEQFQDSLQMMLEECGIQYILLPYLKKSNIYGMTRWINNKNVALAMNIRGKDADKFWFTFFHELGHVLQQKKREILVTDESVEIEADEFARDILIPPKQYQLFIHCKIDKSHIVEFSKQINIASGIVVGRLQHDQIIGYHQYNDLKQKYDFQF